MRQYILDPAMFGVLRKIVEDNPLLLSNIQIVGFTATIVRPQKEETYVVDKHGNQIPSVVIREEEARVRGLIALSTSPIDLDVTYQVECHIIQHYGATKFINPPQITHVTR